MHPNPGIGKCEVFIVIRVLTLGLGNEKTSDVFGRLQTSSGIFGNDHAVFKNHQHSQDKNLTPVSHKKLAGVITPYTM